MQKKKHKKSNPDSTSNNENYTRRKRVVQHSANTCFFIRFFSPPPPPTSFPLPPLPPFPLPLTALCFESPTMSQYSSCRQPTPTTHPPFFETKAKPLTNPSLSLPYLWTEHIVATISLQQPSIPVYPCSPPPHPLKMREKAKKKQKKQQHTTLIKQTHFQKKKKMQPTPSGQTTVVVVPLSFSTLFPPPSPSLSLPNPPFFYCKLLFSPPSHTDGANLSWTEYIVDS